MNQKYQISIGSRCLAGNPTGDTSSDFATMPPVGLARFLVLLLYATYLAYAGLFFLLAPWTEIWTMLVMRLPVPIAVVLGHPAVKGMISAFGLLHFILALFEATTGLRSKPQV